jgi:D-lactate dehydrogenase
MPLLEPDVLRIAPEATDPGTGPAPEWIADGTPQPLRAALESLLGPRRVQARALDLVKYASDASPYRMFPKAVVQAHDARDVAKVFRFGRERDIPVTLRSAGTSLNGQSQSDGILVDVRRHFTGVAVEDEGAVARVRPGTALGHVNRVLLPYSRRLGPDPASTDFATVGGVVANNSGGMRCGTTQDSYSTVRALKLVLPSGTVIDTERAGAEEEFAEAEPELARGLAEIRDEIRGDSDLAERIRRKFRIKNTMGYRLCAFLDADTPLGIFRRLVIGSEGTLALVAEAVFDTVPLLPHTTTTWVHFADIDRTVEPVPDLVAAGATAVEMMVAPALIAAAYSIPGTPEHWRELPPESAALLIEYRSDDPAALDGMEARAMEVLAGREMIRGPLFTREEELTEIYWRTREGYHGIVGRMRPQGTVLIVEDVCVPPERIAESALDLQRLLGKHGFLPGVAGHTSAGNLHFMLTPNFAERADRERYEAFMNDLVDLITDKYDGSLKAEHGTGINMAPYLEREWGPRATEMMWRIKRLADPDGVLGPGVILNRDPDAHLRNLKSMPPIEEVADTCVECGFCEPVCPSRLLTTTPRQRIVLRREMARQPQGSRLQRALLEQYEYDAIETCAADGSCALSCPVGIDTGRLIKDFRNREHAERAERSGLKAAKRWAAIERGARAMLRGGTTLSRVVGDGPLSAVTKAQRRFVSAELIPEWGPGMPRVASARLPRTPRDGAVAVYVPSCVNRIFGPSRQANGAGPPLSVIEAVVAVSGRAGLPVWIPPDVAGHCCAVPWGSKGYGDGHAWMANKMVASLWRWTNDGELPAVIDASSCTHGIVSELGTALDEENTDRLAKLEVLDGTDWAWDRLLPKLDVNKAGAVAVHPTCSGHHLGMDRRLRKVAVALADEVYVPPSAACCGFAGDRGLLHPELTESATQEEAAEVRDRRFDAHVSTNRTCEIGMERATGRPYMHVVQLLEELTRPASAP